MITTDSNLTIIKEYKNNEANIRIYADGTKVRSYDTEYNPVVPESLDVKITDYCDRNCEYCHEQSSVQGEHANYTTVIQRLLDVPNAELALGGGNPLAHPAIEHITRVLTTNGNICNITINESVSEEDLDLLGKLVKLGYIHGIGVSINDCQGAHNFKLNANRKLILSKLPEYYDNVVAHVIAGVHSYNEIGYVLSTYNKVLILGYKDFGKGVKYKDNHQDSIETNIQYLKNNLWRILHPNYSAVVSFDNLAIQQLGVSAHFTGDEWGKFYMGDDGKYSMYYDAVEDKYATSSTNERVSARRFNSILDFFSRSSKQARIGGHIPKGIECPVIHHGDYIVPKEIVKNLSTFEELKKVMHSNYNSNFHSDNMPWNTMAWIKELCMLLDKRK